MSNSLEWLEETYEEEQSKQGIIWVELKGITIYSDDASFFSRVKDFMLFKQYWKCNMNLDNPFSTWF